jgi:hypothetical protein
MALRTIGLRVAVRLAGPVTGAILAGCALSDAFASSGLKPVSIDVESDTVVALFTAPEIPLVIKVMAGGTVLAHPPIILSSSDTSVIQPNAAGDSLIAHNIGRATLRISLKGSMFTDTVPTLNQGIRVRP